MLTPLFLVLKGALGVLDLVRVGFSVCFGFQPCFYWLNIFLIVFVLVVTFTTIYLLWSRVCVKCAPVKFTYGIFR